VANILIYSDSMRSPELRHEVPVAIPDPFLYAERDGRRAVVVSSFEVPRIEALGVGYEIVPPEELGIDDLVAQGLEHDRIWLELVLRACRRLEIGDAVVPAAFPLEVADFLREHGVSVRTDRALFEGRRRVKSEHELAGIRRAQRGAEAGMAAAVALLRRAEVVGDEVRVDGDLLTCERLKAAVEGAFVRHGVVAEEFIVSHGPQTAIGHDSGSGPIAPSEPIVLDLFPRDRASGCFADMTRTYVVGEPTDELLEYHRLAREALDRAVEALRPGVAGKDLHRMTCDLFEAHGYRTQLSKRPGEVLDSGFHHALGHGVGLELHEAPGLGRVGQTLVAGDVVALEPGLYRAGFGGCRLEDLVLVADAGGEVLTDFPYDLVP
jgi:Xaa-Pro aminopeptidase